MNSLPPEEFTVEGRRQIERDIQEEGRCEMTWPGERCEEDARHPQVIVRELDANLNLCDDCLEAVQDF